MLSLKNILLPSVFCIVTLHAWAPWPDIQQFTSQCNADGSCNYSLIIPAKLAANGSSPDYNLTEQVTQNTQDIGVLQNNVTVIATNLQNNNTLFNSRLDHVTCLFDDYVPTSQYQSDMQRLNNTIAYLEALINNITCTCGTTTPATTTTAYTGPTTPPPHKILDYPSSCAEAQTNTTWLYTVSGTYNLSINGDIKEVYCDLSLDDGGWTVIQNRYDGSVAFNKTWTEYEEGFGNPAGEYWLGNKYLHIMTNETRHVLRIDLEGCLDFYNDTTRFMEYTDFQIADGAHDYKLSFASLNLTGSAHDSFYIDGHSLLTEANVPFATSDRDTVNNCSALNGNSGWWFAADSNCGSANLNGQWHGCINNVTHPLGPHDLNGIYWLTFNYTHISLPIASMKIRPVGFVAT